MPTNEQRATHARQAVYLHSGTASPGEEELTDLLTNLMHLCDEVDININAVLKTSRMHYEAECEEEDSSPQEVQLP